MSGMLRSEKARATRKRHRDDNRDRSARFEMVPVEDIDAHFDVMRRVREIHHNGHFGGFSENAQPDRLFDPRLSNLDGVPLGILAIKEEPLPLRFLPESKPDLLRFCERLITIEPDEHLVALVVRGWPAPQSSLAAHVDRLWELYNYDRETYRFVVCGQHYSAQERAFRRGVPAHWPPLTLELVIARTALLWCAHDVQLSIARAIRMERNPFGQVASAAGLSGTLPFLESQYRVLRPSTVISIARPRYDRLLEVLSKRDMPEADQRRYLEKAAGKDAAFRRVLRQAEQLYRHGKAETLTAAVDREIKRMPALIQDLAKQNPFWRGLVDEGAGPAERTFNQLCFSGLTLLQAIAVAILRLCQAEKEIAKLIARTAALPERSPLARLLSLPGYRRSTLGPGGIKRAQNLLRAYRCRFPDKDFETCARTKPFVLSPGEMLDLGNVGMTVLQRAEEFLGRVGRRRVADHEGPMDCIRRTYYLLDVIPDIRLCR